MAEEKTRFIVTLGKDVAVNIGGVVRIMRAPGSRKICIEAPREVRITREKIDEKAEFATDGKSKERPKT